MSYPINYDFVILAVQFLVAYAIASVSLIGYRMFGSQTLFQLSLSFFLVGSGILAQDLGNLVAEASVVGAFLVIGLFLEAFGYIVLALSHVFTVRSEIGTEENTSLLVLPLAVIINQPYPALVMEGIARSISLFMLLYILGENIIFLAKNKNKEALLPIFGFLFLTVSIFIRLFLVLPTSTNELVDLLKLAGFLILSGPVIVLLVRLRGGTP